MWRFGRWLLAFVTAVVPTRDRTSDLAVTLASILAQKEVDLEVVVVDDGSADPLTPGRVVDQLGDRRLRLVRNRSPLGVSAARNTGIALARSEWIAFCDDDDLWAPDKLARQIEAAEAVGRSWAYAGHVVVDDRLRILGGAPPPPPPAVAALLERWNPIPAGSSNVVVRSSLLSTVGVFAPDLQSGGDWDLWIRLARREAPALACQPLLAYRVHGEAMTRNRARMLADMAVIAERYGAAVDKARHYRWAAWDALREGEVAESLRHYRSAVRSGDLLSIVRAMIAIAYPRLPHSFLYRRLRGHRADPAWRARAEEWLVPLRNAHSGQADRR